MFLKQCAVDKSKQSHLGLNVRCAQHVDTPACCSLHSIVACHITKCWGDRFCMPHRGLFDLSKIEKWYVLMSSDGLIIDKVVMIKNYGLGCGQRFDRKTGHDRNKMSSGSALMIIVIIIRLNWINRHDSMFSNRGLHVVHIRYCAIRCSAKLFIFKFQL